MDGKCILIFTLLLLTIIDLLRYDCAEEFARLGLNKDWRISDMNKKFEFSAIYPKQFIVPTYVS